MNIFNDPIRLFNQIPFGLDVSDLSVKMVQLNVSGKQCTVEKYASYPVPANTIVDGEIKNIQSVRDSIIRCIEESKIRTRKVFCSLPEGKSFLRVIEVPRLNVEELEEAIRWQIEENVPMNLDQLYYDWTPIQKSFSKDPKKMNVLLVAVARGVVDSFLEVLQLSGLEAIGMGTESVAQVQSLLSEESGNDETVLVVDIGDRRTTFTFSVGGVPCFTSSSSLSSQMMTDAISKILHVTQEEAEKIKCEQGIGSFIKKDPIFQSVESILENLIEHIATSMDFFVGGLKFSHSIDRVVLCGGGANTEGLPVYLGKRLGKKTERGNPWVRMDLGKTLPKIPYHEAIRYSTAIGLAWQGLQYTYEDIS